MRSPTQRREIRRALRQQSPVRLATRKLKFAALELNREIGPVATAQVLYLLVHQFRWPGAFHDAAQAEWDPTPKGTGRE